jgi:hypothetical protein
VVFGATVGRVSAQDIFPERACCTMFAGNAPLDGYAYSFSRRSRSIISSTIPRIAAATMISGVPRPWAAASCSNGVYVHTLVIVATAILLRTQWHGSWNVCSIHPNKGAMT